MSYTKVLRDGHAIETNYIKEKIDKIFKKKKNMFVRKQSIHATNTVTMFPAFQGCVVMI